MALGDYLVTLILLTIVHIAAVNSLQCTQFYTIFEEKSCSASNYTQMKPALINPTTLNISRYETNLDEYCYELIKEDCFLELSCEDHETTCQEVLVATTETVTTNTQEMITTDKDIEDSTFNTEAVENETDLLKTVEDEVIIEEREFFILFSEKACDGANSTVIEPSPINYEMWNTSRYDLYGYKGCYNSYPALENFLELTCITKTTCNEISVTDKLESKKLDPVLHYSFITIGGVAAAILTSFVGYRAYQKIMDVLQSGVYRLPQ